MIKYSKKGFSLSEVLIALAIVSVIATMGFSIAKKGIENAYQGYYYTGYLGMNTALYYAKKEIYEEDYPEKPTTTTELFKNFLQHIKYNLSLKKDDSTTCNETWNNLNCQYIAPNGIKYRLNHDGSAPLKLDTPPSFRIKMTVPSVKTDNVPHNDRMVGLTYNPEQEFLEPWKGTTPTSNSLTQTNYKTGWVSLYDRKDLLVFHYDDGTPKYNTVRECTDPNDESTCVFKKELNEEYDKPNADGTAKRGYNSYKGISNKIGEYKIKLVNPKYAY